MTQDNHDGPGGTDNVLKLVSNRTKETPSPKDPVSAQAIITACDGLAADAALGKLGALAVVGFMTDGTIVCGTFGSGNYTEFLGGLEDLKYQIILEHQRQQPRKPK